MNFDNKSPEYGAGVIIGMVFMIAFAVYIILLKHSIAHSQDNQINVSIDVLAQSMNKHVIMCKQKYNNEDLLYKFCRKSNKDFGVSCDQNTYEYSKYIIKYAKLYDFDPWLFAAQAFHESKLNAFVVGKVKKERGVFQIHPGNKRAKNVKFVHSKSYREACKNAPGHCQEEIVSVAARIFKDALVECKGNIEQSLSAYNQGECFPIRKEYVKSVFKHKKTLMNPDKLNIKWCHE